MNSKNANQSNAHQTTNSIISFPYLGLNSAEHYFEAVASWPYSLLLHSGGSDKDQYDILLAAPERVIVSSQSNHQTTHRVYEFECDQVSIPMNRDAEFSKVKEVGDLFSTLNRWLKEKGSKLSANETEHKHFSSLSKDVFTGGLAGALSYDFGRQLENIPQSAKNDIELPDLCLGLYYCPVIIDHKRQTVSLYNFFQRPKTAERLAHWFMQNNPTGTSDKSVFKITRPWFSNMAENDYAEKFAKVKHYIKAGDCYQINLAQRFECEYQGNPWAVYKYLVELNQAPFSGYFNLGPSQILSLSPERFISVADGHAITQPIKGTQPRGVNAEQDQAYKEALQNSEKDQAENLMIVDLLRNDLSRTAVPGSVKVSELFGLYSFPSVHHLISTVESDIDPIYSNLDVLRAAFPGGSITGAPKVRAMEIIEELEPHRRSFYCGSLVYFGFNGRMDSNIMIRTLIANQEKLYTWAGGGLVDDSTCELEYQETFTKLSKILDPLMQINESI